MKKRTMYWTIIVLLVTAFAQEVFAADRIPSPGETFPDITLAIPETTAQRDYLGIKGNGPFRLPQIQTDILIIEIFSMYCPYCQKEAPIVNELYSTISGRADLKDKIKVIGIGVGNTPFEVELFKKQYSIAFPLFSDESFAVHKASGSVRTPHFFVLKKNSNKSFVIVYSKTGSIRDPKDFLDIIIKESGLTQER